MHALTRQKSPLILLARVLQDTAGERNRIIKWVEFIHVRSSPQAREALCESLRQPVGECAAVKSVTGAVVLKHAAYPGDVAVMLTWENDRQPVKTREGIGLAEFMGRAGSVEHSVWEVVSSHEENISEKQL